MFLATGAQDPATVLRSLILQAGDVERNPGPSIHTSKCASCKKAIRKTTTPLSCRQIDCDIVCHRTTNCSGISRWNTKPKWLCTFHNPTTPPTQSAQPAQPSTAVAPPNTSTNTNTTPPTQDTQAQKHSCFRCKKTIRRDFTPLFCNHCKKPFHSSCTKLTRDAAAAARSSDAWTCKRCISFQIPDQPLTDPNSKKSVSERSQKSCKPSLKIIQWNCDGLRPKLYELKERLVAKDIDVCMIQETKLRIGDPTPRIPGYAVLRDDRKALYGGGLITYIKETLIYERIGYRTKNTTECMSFRVKLSRNKWIQLTNVYAPPCSSNGQDAKNVATEIIPVTDNSLIVGDFNCHAPLWDQNIPTDQRGDAIENWLSAEDLTTLNSGEPTRTSRIEGQRDSAPDITICGKDFSKKCMWDLMEGIGRSDHIPILIRAALKVNHQSVRGSEAKWKIKNVDWSKFSQAVEESQDTINKEVNIKKRIALYNGILISCATIHVGKVKRPKRPKPWMNPAVRTAVRKRNRIWRERGPEKKEWRAEWLSACKEASDATAQAKAESWKNLLEDAITEKSSDELWKIVKTLDGCPDTNSPNEALVHKGRRITSNKRKANVFMQHYASVSKLNFTKEDRDTNRELKKRLSNAPPNASTPKFNMRELRRAISKMKAKGAAGPDDIPPSFLKALGPKALSNLLDIFNSSFHLADCPQVWKNAIIIPLLKSGKPAGELKSYRPISLTSCVVKLFERMFADRLIHLAETNNWLHSAQAGFRRGRSCEDQILRMVQAISDGFQHKPMQPSVLVLLGFSQAFDTILYHMTSETASVNA